MPVHLNALKGGCLLLACATAACTTGGQKLTRSGFLGDYQAMQKVDGKGNAALWVEPTYAPIHYTKVVIEPIEWRAAPRDRKAQDQLESDFRDALAERLRHRYRLVEPTAAIGADTLRIRAAITNTRRTRWYVNGPAQVATSLTFGTLSLVAPLQGGASVEMQVEDAATGRPLVRMATFRNGRKWEFKGAYVPYQHARNAFENAAGLLQGAMAGNGQIVTRQGEPAYRDRPDG